MNINEILNELKQLEISKDEFYVEENAALVIRGIIHETGIIKICMSSDAIKTLENTHKLIIKDSYNIESICKRVYILLESNNEVELIKKIKEYVGPSFLYVKNKEEYEREKKNGANLEETDSRGETPLFRVVRNDNIELVSRMIDDGANVNALNNKGCNLGFVCNSLNMMKLLIENGLKYNTKNYKGNTILEYVVDNEIKNYLHNGEL